MSNRANGKTVTFILDVDTPLNVDEQENLRRAFHSANGIVALEGWKPAPDDLALQERVILGELTFDGSKRGSECFFLSRQLS